MIALGIDPGATTGYAIWDATARELLNVDSCRIHEAMGVVQSLAPARPFVIFEDARRRRWLEGKGRAHLQGAGSIKRDCSIWEDFLTDLGVPFLARAPIARATKWSAKQFEQLTKWRGKTNEHARDAAMIVYGLSVPSLELLLKDYEQRRKGR